MPIGVYITLTGVFFIALTGIVVLIRQTKLPCHEFHYISFIPVDPQSVRHPY